MTDKTPSGNVFSLEGLKASCSSCNLHDLCLPRGMNDADVAELERIVARARPHPRGKTLFHIDEPFRALYVPRSGALKTFTLGVDGSEQIIGFHLPGEILGLDGLIEHRHQVTAQTLELSAVCEVPFDLLEHAAGRVPALQHQLMRLMSQEIADKEHQLLALGDHQPERRLALLLLDLSRRFACRGFSATEFNLPMSRQDIAAYLRLAAETVSRAFGKLQRDGLLQVSGRLVNICDLDALARFAGHGNGDSDQRRILS
ncbi:MAG: fumarate/nitrate reduction transcriptional regulator Fnr [Immundisolibacter sp.]